VYAFSGFLVVRYIHLGPHVGAATLPWVLGATARGLDADGPRSRAQWMGAAGLFLGGAILSGHLQMPMYGGLGMLLLAATFPTPGPTASRSGCATSRC
jgi:hypothetical protein